MKLPGPDHPINIATNPRRVVVRFNGRTVADTRNALALLEADYPAVNYFPRADVDMSALSASPHSTACPFKGDASYYDLHADGHSVENAVWSYEKPYEAVGRIEAYLAFYPQHVEIEETDL